MVVLLPVYQSTTTTSVYFGLEDHRHFFISLKNTFVDFESLTFDFLTGSVSFLEIATLNIPTHLHPTTKYIFVKERDIFLLTSVQMNNK